MKNYICFINDHSGSMAIIANAAKRDYNATITSVKDSSSREMMDTVVSVVGIGIHDPKRGCDVTWQTVISNPHVLKPVESWPAVGSTPLYDGIGEMIKVCESLPDATDPKVSFLVQITTDGAEQGSRIESKSSIAAKISRLQQTGRWTFVARIPKGSRYYIQGLGIPDGNVIEWDTTERGMEVASIQTQQAFSNYYALRSAGQKSSNVFYANAANVDTSHLVDISNKVSLYVVGDQFGEENGIEIRDFVLKRRAQYLKGAAFYQLTKTESKIGEKKMVIVRDRSTGKTYGGVQAREMIGLPKYGNARLHPGDHKNFDIFIQSESVNRKLVKGTGVMYWEEMGVPFTQDELDRFLGNKAVAAPVKPAVVQLPAVPVTNRPTPSPIPVTHKAQLQAQLPLLNGRPIRIVQTRDEARKVRKGLGQAIDLKKHQNVPRVGVDPAARWAVYA